MKRIIQILALLALATMAISCDKDENPEILSQIFLGDGVLTGNEPKEPTYPYIDLGLSVNWGEYNVGDSEEDPKHRYYAWGETSTKSEYTWSNYKLSTDGGKTLTKYCTDKSYGKVDKKTTLEAKDDVATQALGKGWRTPTRDEYKELVSNCTWKATTINNRIGIIGTSKINGAEIFFPFAGYVDEKSLYDKNYLGVYWTSTLHSTPTEAMVFYLNYKEDEYGFATSSRCLGMVVRGVYEKK